MGSIAWSTTDAPMRRSTSRPRSTIIISITDVVVRNANLSAHFRGVHDMPATRVRLRNVSFGCDGAADRSAVPRWTKCSVALSLCTTAHPFYTIFTKRFGAFFLKRQCNRTLGGPRTAACPRSATAASSSRQLVSRRPASSAAAPPAADPTSVQLVCGPMEPRSSPSRVLLSSYVQCVDQDFSHFLAFLSLRCIVQTHTPHCHAVKKGRTSLAGRGGAAFPPPLGKQQLSRARGRSPSASSR